MRVLCFTANKDRAVLDLILVGELLLLLLLLLFLRTAVASVPTVMGRSGSMSLLSTGLVPTTAGAEDAR